jgi:hypothetical protein
LRGVQHFSLVFITSSVCAIRLAIIKTGSSSMVVRWSLWWRNRGASLLLSSFGELELAVVFERMDGRGLERGRM